MRKQWVYASEFIQTWTAAEISSKKIKPKQRVPTAIVTAATAQSRFDDEAAATAIVAGADAFTITDQNSYKTSTESAEPGRSGKLIQPAAFMTAPEVGRPVFV